MTGILYLFILISCAVCVVLIVMSTLKRKGRWGINTKTMVCPKCGAVFPTISKPENLRQILWGGRTCKGCGCEVDKWGNEVVGR
jgi:hypothetical protein